MTQKWDTAKTTDHMLDFAWGFHIAPIIPPPLSLATFKEHIHQISEGPIKQLIISCVMYEQKKCPPVTVVHESITDIVTS